MSLSNAFQQEFDREVATTRRVLERVPADKYSWKPHPKSMSLGELAMHVAMIPDEICSWAHTDVKEFGGGGKQPVPTSAADLTNALDKSAKQMKDTLAKLGDEGLKSGWKAVAGGNTVFEMPKAALIRSIALNHWYHHRGQLSVYLRLLDVPVPSIYGPSADEAIAR
jgi:uncharacterized damage-inducible protein DinB